MRCAGSVDRCLKLAGFHEFDELLGKLIEDFVERAMHGIIGAISEPGTELRVVYVGCRKRHALCVGEGHGGFLQAAIQNDPVFEDTLVPGGPAVADFNLENESPPVLGPTFVSAVASFLWDLYDATNEGVDGLTVDLQPIFDAVSSAHPQAICPFAPADNLDLSEPLLTGVPVALPEPIAATGVVAGALLLMALRSCGRR